MSKIRKIYIILFFLVNLVCSSPERKNFSKNMDWQNLVVDGRQRKYLLHIPKKKFMDRSKIPLLVLLHGRSGTAKLMMEGYGMVSISDREGFAIVFPNGYDRSWADGRGGTPSDKAGIDDVQFLEKLVQELVQKYPVDSEQVFIAGHSNGGFMTQRMLIEKTHLFKAGVSVTATISKNVLKKMEPKRPVSVAFICGTEDPLVPYTGGYVVDGEEVLGVEDSVQRWLKWNTCRTPASVTKIDSKNDQTSLEIYNYPECSNKVSVKLYKILGAGHNWPGVDQKIPFVDMGKPTLELNASEEIWKIMKESL